MMVFSVGIDLALHIFVYLQHLVQKSVNAHGIFSQFETSPNKIKNTIK